MVSCCVVLCFPAALSDSRSREGKELVMAASPIYAAIFSALVGKLGELVGELGSLPIHAAIFSGKTRSDEEAVGVKKSG